MTLARNDDYWGGKPKLDKVVYRFIGEPGTQVAELQAGRIDVATLIPLGLIETVKKSGNATSSPPAARSLSRCATTPRAASRRTATCAAR